MSLVQLGLCAQMHAAKVCGYSASCSLRNAGVAYHVDIFFVARNIPDTQWI